MSAALQSGSAHALAAVAADGSAASRSAIAGATTVHCQPCAAATVGFVFICPGRFEASRGYPCAAGTGANLARALVELNRRAPGIFRSARRDDYVVTNAWATVEYPALTGRSVPSEAEVLAPANLARLAAEIAALDTVVACGAQAHAALRAIARQRPGLRVAFARHLSQRSVNMIPGGTDTPQRIARWVDQVLAQWPTAVPAFEAVASEPGCAIVPGSPEGCPSG